VRNDMGDGWLWVTSKSTGLSGIVNRELVKDLVSLVATVCLTPTDLLHNCFSIISSPQNICLYVTPDCRRVFRKLILHFRHRVDVCHIVLLSVFLNAFLQIFARKIIYHLIHLIQGIISLLMHGKTLTLMLGFRCHVFFLLLMTATRLASPNHCSCSEVAVFSLPR